MQQPETLLIKPPRDGRLDALRGLCLLGMVLTHLIEQGLAVPWVVREVGMHWLRFAAGGFVMTSGICIGFIHYRRALDPTRRINTYVSLLKRAGAVLLAHYFATTASLLLIPIHGWPLTNVSTLLWQVLTFQTGYDLLLFYVFMLAISPVIIVLMRRAGLIAVLVISTCIFYVKYDNPYLMLWGVENHFPLLRWQWVFVTGMLVGAMIPRFDALSVRSKWTLFFITALAALVLSIISAFERHGGLELSRFFTVQKLPLTITETLRYAALTISAGVLVDRAWPMIGHRRVAGFLTTLGIQSLLLWIVHVPIVANVVTLPWLVGLFIAITGVWIVAAIGLWIARTWANRFPNAPRLGYLVPVVGTILIACVLVLLQSAPSISQ